MSRNIFLVPIFLVMLTPFWSCQKDDLSTDGVDLPFVESDYDVPTILANNGLNHEETTDYVWDASSEINIILNGNSISTNSSNVTIDETTARITAAGNYNISGNLADGQIVVDTDDASLVRLIFNNIDITNTNSSAIFISNAAKTIIVLPDGTENYLADGTEYIFEYIDDDEPDATLFSKDNLSIFGNGKLTIDANYNDAITSKDGLIIASGTINATAKDDGIRGKDYLIIKDGNITIEAEGDGLKSNNDTDVTLGYVHIENGTIAITSGADAIQAKTDLLIEGGNFDLTSGGGSSASSDAKGLKSTVHLIIDGGIFQLNTANDAIHSNNNLVINSGTMTIASNDDGIHADSSLSINGGEIIITKSYEGIESRVVIINDGNINLKSSDDGINVAGGSDGSGNHNFPGGGGSASEDVYLSINGGNIVVDAAGDGLDANGYIEMTGGVVLVNGPTANNNGALDYDGSFNISGGIIAAVGSANMAQAPSSSSSQYAVLVGFGATKSAGTLIHIESSDGADVLTFKPSKNYQSLSFSSPELKKGSQYSIFTSGNSTGTNVDGLFSGGDYSGGTSFADFTVSDIVTVVQ